MRVPLSWLKEYVDVAITPEELAERLTMAGLEVEAIDYIGVEAPAYSPWAPNLAAASPPEYIPWDRERVLVGELLEVKPHPNADRLTIPVVGYGEGRSLEVVTGAPNITVGMAGQKVVLALNGTRLIDGHSDTRQWATLKPSKIRGVRSEGMVCSELELGLSEEHEGIIFLPDDAPVGTPLADYLGDVVLDIAVTPNFARAMSILGVAREVAALTGAPFHPPTVELEATGPNVAGRLTVEIENPAMCPRFVAGLLEGVEIGPSPAWMQRRLRLAGMRPIFNIVDVSNYVMLELGQPTHAFDADTVADRHLVARQARAGEQLRTLDGARHTLHPDQIVVADPRGAQSVAGVMGGAATEVSEQTRNVLLEAALWNPVSIRRTARALNLPSEASRRFERGVDPEGPPRATQRCLQLMQQVAGGTVAQGLIDVYPEPKEPVRLVLPVAEVRRLLGVALGTDTIADILRRLDFGCEVGDGTIAVDVPSYRLDVTIVPDLIEEVARVYGYGNIPTTRLADELPPAYVDQSLAHERDIKDTLVAAGLREALTYSLTNLQTVAAFEGAEQDPAEFLHLENPLSQERNVLRRAILPELLTVVAANLHERRRVCLFETGRVIHPTDALLPDEPRRLAIAMAGDRVPTSWQDAEPAPIDFFDLKGVLEALLRRLGVEREVVWSAAQDSRFHPGRSAVLRLADGRMLGVAGELHPATRERLDLDVGRVCAAELDLDLLISLIEPTRYEPILRQPAAYQDIAVIVRDDQPAEQVRALIERNAGTLAERVELFDVYRGAPIPAGQRSLAFRMVFRAADRTLADAEISKIREKIARRLETELGATVRV
jgi:phenylalanyl-tRNA synthetase beta chain